MKYSIIEILICFSKKLFQPTDIWIRINSLLFSLLLKGKWTRTVSWAFLRLISSSICLLFIYFSLFFYFLFLFIYFPSSQKILLCIKYISTLHIILAQSSIKFIFALTTNIVSKVYLFFFFIFCLKENFIVRFGSEAVSFL